MPTSKSNWCRGCGKQISNLCKECIEAYQSLQQRTINKQRTNKQLKTKGQTN